VGVIKECAKSNNIDLRGFALIAIFAECIVPSIVQSTILKEKRKAKFNNN